MMGSQPPEPPDRATRDADDLTKTRYGDPYSPPSAAGSLRRPATSTPDELAVQSVPAIGPTKPPALPSKRRAAASSPPEPLPPSAAEIPDPADPRTTVFVPLEHKAIEHGEQTRAAGSPQAVAPELTLRSMPAPDRARGGGDGKGTLVRKVPSPRLRMSRTDVIVSNPLARRVYPRDTLVVAPARGGSRWPLLSMLALALSVVALGVAIATLAPRDSARGSKAALAIAERRAALASPPEVAGHLAQIVQLPQAGGAPQREASPLTAAAPRLAHRTRVDPPPSMPATKRGRDSGPIRELEREARDHLAQGDYAAAKRSYERLRALAPSRREYAAMLDLLTARLASCGRPGADRCSPP
jgi:hypothetical protein